MKLSTAFMERKTHIAVHTFWCKAAGRTDQNRCISPSVLKENHLFLVLETGLDVLHQYTGKVGNHFLPFSLL